VNKKPYWVISAGDTFGRLRVVSRADPINGAPAWNCICECGTRKAIKRHQLIKAYSPTRSCGCLQRQVASELFKKHGGYGKRSYACYRSMLTRCCNAYCGSYSRYGGVGIKVCDRWLSSYADFLSDMGEPPTETHTIDRIDSSGNYEPGNCKWSTPKEQAANRRPKRRRRSNAN
jgi:hypothetical protein